MATVYRYVNGQPIQRYMAVNPRTQAALRTHAYRSRVRGNRILAEHVHAGHSYVTAEKDNAIDWRVTLRDPSGPDPYGKYPNWMGAMSIEYGRQPGTTSPWGPMKGLYVLHRATGASTASRRFGGVKRRIKVKGGLRRFQRFE